MRGIINLLCFVPLSAVTLVPLFSPVMGAGPGYQGFTDPADIDRAVINFTGAAIGEIGGARLPADRRLRLSQCTNPLQTSWHGREGHTVQVECPDAGGWRIFISTRPQPAVQRSAQANQRVVKRGDPITISVRGSGFSIQHSGEAMDSGAIGDWIGVRIARDQEPVRARIERPGLAVIPAS
ncbi:MAG: flagella basal body P-ring formation protein FlgA [Erythrobacter sp.]